VQSEDTEILYVTTGTLVQKMLNSMKNLIETYTHIIIDEVHERTQETDFCLLLVKNLQSFGFPLKLILMSASIQSDLFAMYFCGNEIQELTN